GGGGRYLVLHIPAQQQLAVFDVSAAKVVKTLSTSGDNPKLAGGMDKFVVVYPASATVERWNFTTFKREAKAELNMKVPPIAVALGSASDGQLVISGVDYPRLGETVFFDIRTMRRLEMPFDPHRFFETSPSAFLRASADGRTFVCQSQAGAAIQS